MTDSPVSDEDLMIRAQKGNSEAFEAIVDRYKGRLMGFLGPYCRWDRALAEELVQRTFVKGYEKRASWQAGRLLAPWFFRIARNEAVDAWRRAKRLESGVQSLVSGVNAPTQGVDLEEQEELERLLKALDELPDKQRETVNLVRQGFSHQEISDIQGLKAPAVRQNLSRAIRTLRKILREIE